MSKNHPAYVIVLLSFVFQSSNPLSIDRLWVYQVIKIEDLPILIDELLVYKLGQITRIITGDCL